MGIKHLNTFLTNHCSRAISKIHVSEFSGKSVAIDASIYLYRFIADNKLIEHTFSMVSIFRNYNIQPIFVFDGTPPPEKKDTLVERRENKRAAKAKYDTLKEANPEQDTEEMEKLKRQFVNVKDSDIQLVKSLLDDYGVAWISAPGEAVELCAHLMHTNQVYACMSDDMDMFAYGCVHVFRHFSLVKHTVLFYDLAKILTHLQMTVQEFRQVIVLSGTDYNKDNTTDLVESMRWFGIYKRDIMLREGDVPTFYEWLLQNTKYIQNIEKLNTILTMFKPKSNIVYTINKSMFDQKHLFETLASDGFVFL